MKKPRRESWLRDVARIVLLSAAMVGVPAAGWAITAYRKHIEAYYWAWVWTNEKRPSFHLARKMTERGIPRQARVGALRFAYRRSEGTQKETAAFYVAHCRVPRSEMAGIRGLYDLVKHERDEESCAARALRDELIDIGWPGMPWAIEKDDGFTNVKQYRETSPGSGNGVDIDRLAWSLDFGSYHVDCYERYYFLHNPDGTTSRQVLWLDATVTRLPGPWRDLPPIPPLPELPDDYDSQSLL